MKARVLFAWALAVIAIPFACYALFAWILAPSASAPPRPLGASSWLDQSFAPLPITTTDQYTQPTVGSTVSVAFDSTANVAVGVTMYVVGGGYYSVSSVTDNTHAVLKNLGTTGNASPTAVIAGGARATLTGPSGFGLSPGGDLADGGTNIQTVVGLQGRPISDAGPSTGSRFYWDGTKYSLGFAAASGAGTSRPTATGSGSFYFLTDAPIGYFDDPGSSAWKQFPFATFTGSAPAIGSYTVLGSIALSQVADAVSAVSTTNAANIGSVALLAGSLGSSSTWVVTLQAAFQPAWIENYPEIGAVVSDGIVGGTSNVYAMACASQGATNYLCHQEKFAAAGARISASGETGLTSHVGGPGGVMRLRILADGVNAHYQISNNGIRWIDFVTAATPTSLAYYGFTLGNNFVSSASYGQAWVLENSLKSLTVAQSSVSAMSGNGATPIAVTTSGAHGLASGDLVAIHGSVGNTSANTGAAANSANSIGGSALVTVTDSTHFSLPGLTGNGTWTSGGTVTLVSR